MGGRAKLIGIVGDDEAGQQVRRELKAAGLDDEGLVVDNRPTTRKVRIVTVRNQQVARLDYENDGDVSGAALNSLCDRIVRSSQATDAIVLSDYRKGVVTPALIERAIAAATDARVPLLVDPKVPQAERYRGATLVTPNHHETELMTGMRIRTPDDARRAARRLHEQTGASVLITREHGVAAGGVRRRSRRRVCRRRRMNRRRHGAGDGHRDARARPRRRRYAGGRAAGQCRRRVGRCAIRLPWSNPTSSSRRSPRARDAWSAALLARARFDRLFLMPGNPGPTRFSSSDPDPALYASLSAKLPCSRRRWIAPEWWGPWPEAHQTGYFREHPAGLSDSSGHGPDRHPAGQASARYWRRVDFAITHGVPGRAGHVRDEDGQLVLLQLMPVAFITAFATTTSIRALSRW